VTGQFADELAVSQIVDWTGRGLVNSEMLDRKFGVYNRAECDFQ